MPNKQTVDLVIYASHILPVIPRGAVFKDHAVVVDKGKILAIIPQKECELLFFSTDTQKFSSHVIMPGLINAHGHAAMTLFRGLADDLPLMEWLNDHIWPAEGKWVSEEFVYNGTQLAIAEMIRSGTSCFSDMYFFPEMAAKAALEMGIRAQLCCPILDFPTAWGSGPEEYIDKSLALYEQYKDSQIIQIALGPHAPYTVSDAPLEKIKNIAIEKHIPVQIHLHETQFEVDEAIKDSGIRPIQRLANLGLISKELALQCVHMTALNKEDIAILENSNAHIIHCPESNLKLASGFCEVDKLLKHNLNVALGTDGAASNNDLDMFGELRCAALIAKPIAQNASALDAITAIELATINGAKALGLDSITGSLEPGKSADFIAIDLNRLNSQPSYNIQSDIVYSVNSQQVSDHWIQGKQLLKSGNFTKIDVSTILKNAQMWADMIKLS
jgi:5-methylthioadenosine/S-adenosylhomocysteine deaminase